MDYPLSWLQGASLGERIESELRFRIINGTINAGTILSENQIATEFMTSRSPVREALRALANEGLIRLERMGAVVLGLTLKDIEELYDVRFLIENFVLRRLINHTSEDLLTKLNQTVDKMQLACEHSDGVEFAFQDLQFHEILISESKHGRILHLWNGIRHIVRTALLVATQRRFAGEKVEIDLLIEKHRSMIKALESGDPEYMTKVVQEHFEDTKRTVSQILDQK